MNYSDKQIERWAHGATTDEDLLKVVKTNIIPYSKLKNVKKIDDILINNSCIFLIENTMGNNVGHWVCIVKRPQDNTLSYFDSYGRLPDYYKQKDPIPEISRLMYYSPYKLEYNSHDYQSKGYATCGRHCIVRIIMKDEPLSNYYKLMKTFKNDDELVTFLTSMIQH
jgi:hypothetical protein